MASKRKRLSEYKAYVPLPPLVWKPIKERGDLEDPPFELPLDPDPYAAPYDVPPAEDKD